MDDTNGVENAAASAQVAAALRLARIIVAAKTVAANTGSPLNDQQLIALLTVALLEFDGYRTEVQSLVEIEHLLATLGENGRRAD